MSFFDAVKQVPRATTVGNVMLPITYQDASSMGAFFRVDIARASELLPDELEPWPVLGKAIAAIYAWEYRESSVGSYGEVGLGIQARRKGTRPSLVRLVSDMAADDNQGIWVVTLPVTTDLAFRAGKEIWGYPKYVTPIETRFGPGEGHVRLGDELTLDVKGAKGPSRPLPVVTYTKLDGQLLRTEISVEKNVRFGLGGSASLKIQGKGPTSDAVVALGMDQTSAVMTFRCEPFRAILPPGRALRA